MKFMIDERAKHRLTGVVVIVSIAVIFLPAMLKKSNQRFEESIHVSLKLPSKPVPPKVAMPKPAVMFKSLEVAHVELPKLPEVERPVAIAKAESLSKPPAPVLAKVEPIVVKPAVVKPALTKPATVKLAVVKPPVMSTEKKVALMIKKDLYGVQVASFTQERNAIALVTRLKKEGFTANYSKFEGKQGLFYQVVVGQLNQKVQAVSLQKKLATNLQLNGMIIKTGVS